MNPLCVVFAFASFCSNGIELAVPIDQLMSQAAAYDARDMRIRGTARNVEKRIARSGLPYEIFFLCEHRCVQVYYREQTSIADGANVEVSGWFQHARHIGNQTYHDEITAHSVVRL